MSNSTPKVTIGLPVYNGENFLAEAIESVLQQTFSDFELIISDNASTDGTADLCARYANQDKRVRYRRNERNLGAARNYDLVWHQGSGRYFKWLAHDDRLLPGYLEATVAALDSNPDAVLCNTVVDYIDEHSKHLGYYRSVIRNAGSADPAERFAAIILHLHTCVDFFGVLRRQAMKNSLLHQPFRGSDRAFLAQMALRGRMLQLDQPLVQMRQHANQYAQIRSVRQQLAWQDPDLSKNREVAILKLYGVYRHLVDSESLSDAERRACRIVLRRFWMRGWTCGRLIAELISIPFPRASSVIRDFAIKLRVAGAPKDFLN